jgi:dipeptidyl aminopeptidase/acylaminoacyl peptidase
MQDDLGDAANWLAANYSVDKKSICILGASYGGYAAMMGAVKQQHIFKCAASFAGVSDLNLLLIKARKFSNYDVVEKQIGSNASERKKRSPINYAKDINIPLMLIHGDQDIVVSVDQSRKMFSALQKHNKLVEYIELKNGNHNLSIEQNRLSVLSSLEAFFDKHIPVLNH